jgi:integrase
MSECRKIGLREVRALDPDQEVWETSLPGFGARRQKSDAVSYFVMYRPKGERRQRRHTIGRHGAPWTPETARDEAKRVLGEVSQGADPSGEKIESRRSLTVAEVADQYLADAESGRLLTRRRTPKKASTLATDKSRVERHIKPLLGRLPVAEVSQDDIETFLHDVAEGKTALREKTANLHGFSVVRGGRGAATRTTGLLGAIFSYAVRRKLRQDNPVHGVTRFADGRRERRLSEHEYKVIGKALRLAAEANAWPPAIAATRFLVMTGWRSGEALGLRWKDVDLDRQSATLADTKTGRSIRPLSRRAFELLRGVKTTGDLVFPSSRGEGRMGSFIKVFARIARLVNLPNDISPHVFRHSFASLASDLGFSEATIAVLVGHKGHSITSRYIHSADAVLVAAADRIAEKIANLMGEGSGDEKTIPLADRARKAADA